MARMTERRNDIDWLRALAMLVVFFFHCARFFDDGGWHAKSGEVSYGMSVFVGVVAQWLMPLFFVLSGISSYYALNYLRSRPYLGARVKRLLVPLIVGSLTHISFQVYIERATHGGFSGSFFAFYPHYFDGFYAFGGNFAWMGLHLWYLEMLFLFSLITLPFFIWTRSEKMKKTMAGIAGFLAKPCAVFLLAVPLGIVESLVNLDPRGVGTRDFGGWALFPHLVFFVSGYLLATDGGLRPALEKQRAAALGMGIIATAVGFYLLEYADLSPYGYPFSFLRAFNSWFWLVAILGFGSKHLNFNNRALEYAGEAVLPFYILHQSVIIVIGYFMIDWTASVMLQYVFLCVTSFAAIMTIYELGVRRFNAMRFLFGMKLKRREAPHPEPLAEMTT
ncbi:acyltransferase [Candidatus Poribacteria bacterium]|nr:acyltransferase [Candidatus Poribacteria bacterium]